MGFRGLVFQGISACSLKGQAPKPGKPHNSVRRTSWVLRKEAQEQKRRALSDKGLDLKTADPNQILEGFLQDKQVPEQVREDTIH